MLLSLNFVTLVSAQPAPPNSTKPNVPTPSVMPPLVQKAAAAFNRGMLRQNEKRYAEALKAYREFLDLGTQAKLPPTTLLSAYQNMVLIYLQQGKQIELEAALRKVVAIDGKNAFALAQLAGFAVERKNYQEAEGFANRSLALKPPAPVQAQAYYALGTLANAKRDAAGAEKAFAQAVKLAPQNAQTHYAYALALASRNQREAAIKEAEKAVSLAPNLLPAYLFLGALRQRKGDFTGALAAYDSLLKYDKTNREARFSRAFVLQKIGQASAAAKAYSAYLEMYPKTSDLNAFAARFNLGQLSIMMNNLPTAKKQLTAAVKINSKNAQAWSSLAYAEAAEAANIFQPQQRDAMFDSAETHYNKALALAPNDKTARDGLALLYEKANKYDDALVLNRKRLTADPKNIDHYYRQARIYTMQRKANEVYQTWTEYRKVAPDDSRSYLEAAGILQAQGKFTEANIEWKLWLEKHPDDGQAQLAVAQNLAQMSSNTEAEAQFQSVLKLDKTASKVTDPKLKPAALAAAETLHIEALRGSALLAQKENKMDAAIDYWQRVKIEESGQAARTQRPTNPATFRALAAAYERAQKPELALKEFESMAAQFPKDGTPFVDMARLLEGIGKLDDAADAYRKGAARTNDPLDYRLQIAEMYRRRGKFDQALTAYEGLRTEFPKDMRPLMTMAQLYEQTGKDEKAFAAYELLLKSDPKQTWIPGKQAQVLIRLKRWNEARTLFEKQIAQNPEDYQRYADLARVYTEEGKPDGYLDFLKVQLEKFPFRRTLKAVTLDQFIQRKQEEEGWRLLRENAEEYGKDKLALEAYANLLIARKKDAEALAIWRRIVALNSKDIPAHTELIAQLDRNNLTEEATKLLESLNDRADVTAEQKRPLRSQLAYRYVQQNRKEDAVKLYEQVRKQTPGDVEVIAELANLYVTLERDADAIPLYKILRESSSYPPNVRAQIAVRIGELLEKLGRKPAALTEYKNALRLDPNAQNASAAVKRLEETK